MTIKSGVRTLDFLPQLIFVFCTGCTLGGRATLFCCTLGGGLRRAASFVGTLLGGLGGLCRAVSFACTLLVGVLLLLLLLLRLCCFLLLLVIFFLQLVLLRFPRCLISPIKLF